MKRPRKIGPYRVLYRLGKGGSSEVYAATGPWAERVALKIQRVPKKRQRFLQELDVLNHFNHPSLSPTLAFGIDVDGWSYLVMQLIDGRSATSYTQSIDRKDRQAAAVRIAIEVAEILGHLHKKGWIHGDVKSKNILIDRKGRAHLIDFELARPVAQTGRGKFFGTRSYAPPEQHGGKKLTPAVDVYTLAGVLCRMIGGKLPFPRSVDVAERPGHLQLPSLPPKLRELVTRSLSPDPALRPPDGAAFASALRKISSARRPILEAPSLTHSEMASSLRSCGLTKGDVLPTLAYLSGSMPSLCQQLVSHRRENSDWLPPPLRQQWIEEVGDMEPLQRRGLGLIAMLGGRVRARILSAQLKVSGQQLQKLMLPLAHWVHQSPGHWCLHHGAANGLLIRALSPKSQAELLDNDGIRSTTTGRLAVAISNGNYQLAAQVCRAWISSHADSLQQWFFVHRLMHHGLDLTPLRKILICRWRGDWAGSLGLMNTPVTREILEIHAQAGRGSIHRLAELNAHSRSKNLDVLAASRILLSEWHLAHGRFYHALSLLKPLQQLDDPYIRILRHRQYAVLYTHMALQTMSNRHADGLEELAITEELLGIVSKIRAGEWTQNHLPLDRLGMKTPYLQAWLQLNAKAPDPSVIRSLPTVLSLQDRSALLANPIWRPYERALGLPQPPKP